MSAVLYLWRRLNQKQREELLAWRKARGHPWHSPPHRPNFGHLRFLISAACYEHRHYIGHSLELMNNFTRDLLAVFGAHSNQTFAWCVLPNHYHALVEVPNIKGLLRELGITSWSNFTRLESRGGKSRPQDFLSRCRTRDALGAALLGDIELCPSQSGQTRIRGMLDGLAMEQRSALPRANRNGGGETYLAGLSDT
jgi:REP element-mobilizing transposase RayT